MTKIIVGSVKHFSVKLVDATGNPASCDGSGVVAVAGDASVENVAADGLSGDLRVNGLGVGQVSVTVDADLGAGVRNLVIPGDFEGIAGEAVAGTIEFTDPTP